MNWPNDLKCLCLIDIVMTISPSVTPMSKGVAKSKLQLV